MSASDPHEQTKKAWTANAQTWDARMGSDGNDFFKQLQYPYILEYLGCQNGEDLQGKKILDISCGNGILSRKLAALGANVTGIDFSESLIKIAEGYATKQHIDYAVVDVTDANQLQPYMSAGFDIAICNMALFDISNIEILISALPKMLRPGGLFIFSLLHPAFNNSSTIKMVEEYDDGAVKQKFSLKIDKYLSIYEHLGVALREQTVPQVYFNRPLQYYFKLCFQHGFVMDRFDEPALPSADTKASLSWGSNFEEIPPVCMARMKLI